MNMAVRGNDSVETVNGAAEPPYNSVLDAPEGLYQKWCEMQDFFKSCNVPTSVFDAVVMEQTRIEELILRAPGLEEEKLRLAVHLCEERGIVEEVVEMVESALRAMKAEPI